MYQQDITYIKITQPNKQETFFLLEAQIQNFVLLCH